MQAAIETRLQVHHGPDRWYFQTLGCLRGYAQVYAPVADDGLDGATTFAVWPTPALQAGYLKLDQRIHNPEAQVK